MSPQRQNRPRGAPSPRRPGRRAGQGPGKRPRPRQQPRRPNPLLQQATDEATTVFGPQRFALDELLRGYRSDVKQGIQAEEGAARGIIAATKAASPVVKRVYDRAGEATGVVDRDLAGHLAPLSQSADPYRAVAARESAGTRRRMEESEAGALSELQQRKVGAQQGRGHAVGNLIGEYRDNASKVRRSRVDLARQQAAHIGATFGDLKEARSKARMEERDFQLELSKFAQSTENANRDDRRAARDDRRQARTDRQRIALQRRGQDVTIRGQDLSDARSRGGVRGSGGSRFTPTQQRAARNEWVKAMLYARKLKKSGKLRPGTGEGVIQTFAVARGIDERIARGAVQRVLYGGVRRPQRRILRRDYGLAPPLHPPGAIRRQRRLARRDAEGRALRYIKDIVPGI